MAISRAISRLFVLLGAGASRDAGAETEYKPPLTRELFSRRFNRILVDYPPVDGAAAEIRRATAAGAIVLEQHLATRYMAPDVREHAAQTGRTLPLYLQDVLTEASCCAWGPRNYDLLSRSILDSVEAVTFITLNYDTILDARLSEIAPLESLSDYIAPDRLWSLIKLHGSINWTRAVAEGDRKPYNPRSPSRALADRIKPKIE